MDKKFEEDIEKVKKELYEAGTLFCEDGDVMCDAKKALSILDVASIGIRKAICDYEQREVMRKTPNLPFMEE